MLVLLICLAVILGNVLAVADLQIREGCGTEYFLCSPKLATSDTLGVPSSGWKDLYADILSTINNDQSSGDSSNSTDEGPAKRQNAFCCAQTSVCLLLKGFGIPMCWDQFTTDIFFPDGSYATVVTGNLTTRNGDKVDLVYGNFTLEDGTTGNIYSSGGQTSMLDTSTMMMPTPWTGSGVGSAIPATELGTTGILSTVTTIVPGTTKPPSTLPSLTITMIATMTGCGHCVGNNTTIAGPTVPGTTHLPSTSVFTTGVITPPPYQSVGSVQRCNMNRELRERVGLAVVFALLGSFI